MGDYTPSEGSDPRAEFSRKFVPIFEREGIRYGWWANTGMGGITLEVVERLCQGGAYPLILETPARLNLEVPGIRSSLKLQATDVYVAEADWDEFNTAMWRFAHGIFALPDRARACLLGTRRRTRRS